MAFFKRR